MSVDAPLLRRLRDGGFDGRVHSVFDRVVNVEDRDGALVTLAVRSLDNAPDTAVLDIGRFGERVVAPGVAVSGGAGALQLGESLRVTFDTAQPWSAALPAYPASEHTLRANLDVIDARLDRFGFAAASTVRRSARGFDAEVAARLGQLASDLVDALSCGDDGRACDDAKSMLGLGSGLTPSGDDFLVGLFAVLNVDGSPGQGLLAGGAAVLDGAARSTHAISLAALRNAARGRVRESIVALIEQLTVSGSRERMLDTLQRVLAIGSTSGADIVAGIAAGFQVHLHLSHGGPRPCRSRP